MNDKLFNKKMSVRLQARFARRLATLLEGGISLPEALSFMARSVPKRKSLYGSYICIIDLLKKGKSCSHAFETSGLFDQSILHMVHIGERSGSLEVSLTQAAAMLERRDEIAKKIIGVMIYPAFITFATAGIALFLILYIFPKIIPLITSMNIPLPFLTRLLLGINRLLTLHWLPMSFLALCCIVIGTLLWKLIPRFQESVRIILFYLPILGEIFKAPVIIQIFRSLGLLLSNGEMLPHALASIRNGIAYTEFKRSLDDSIALVNRGGKLSDAFSAKSRSLFSGLIIDLIETGERTGGVAAACNNIARIYESEFDEIVQRLSRVIEPVLMLGMGGIVGSIALSIVMPIYEITNHISK